MESALKEKRTAYNERLKSILSDVFCGLRMVERFAI